MLDISEIVEGFIGGGVSSPETNEVLKGFVEKAVRETESGMDGQPSDVKKKAAVMIACTLYDVADATVLHFPDIADDIIKEHLIPALVEFTLTWLKENNWG